MKPVRYLGPAENELYETAEYYESIQDGLGFSFLDHVQSALNSIVENPSPWAEISPNIRRRLVNRFPYGVLYREEAKEIVILAIMHLRKKPNCWKERSKL